MRNVVENQVRGVTSNRIVRGFEDHCTSLAFIFRETVDIGRWGTVGSGHLIHSFKSLLWLQGTEQVGSQTPVGG